MTVKYPEITVHLSGGSGNASAIIGAVMKALRRGGVDAATISDFTAEATSGDYDNVIQTAMRWVEVD